MPRILIIDDEKAALEMLEDYFLPRGWEVICAATSSEGLRIAFEERPDAVILDFCLPDGPGDDALRQIKAYLPEIKVVIVTGESNGELKERMLGYGADAYLNKGDFTLAELSRTLSHLLA